MWPFSKKCKLADSGYLNSFTEHHCHLLPGVDDGVQTMEETLKLLALYEEMGIKEVWLTPHIMEDVPNTPEGLRKRFGELKAEYQGGIELHLAAEHMMDALFEERLEKGEVMPIGKEQRHLLVETSYFNPPMDLDGILQRVKSAGYFPILAHPERYMYMDMKDYKRLKSMDILFQLNLPSLAGMYGKTVQGKAETLLKKGFYNLTGSDTHRLRQFAHLCQEAKIKEKYVRMIGELKM